MKRLITILAVTAAMSTQAASFIWEGSTAITFNGTKLTENTVVYLVYLGKAGSELSITTAAQNSDNIVQDTTPLTSARSAGKYSETFSKTLGATLVGEDTFTPGVSTFGVFIQYVADGNTYYNFSSSTYTLASSATEISTDLAATFNFTDSSTVTTVADMSSAPTSGWVAAAVPEPSTAALALAGLALLLKRRKA